MAVGLGGFPTSADGWFSSKPGSSWHGGGALVAVGDARSV